MTAKTPNSLQRLRGNPSKRPLSKGNEPKPAKLVALGDPPVEIVGKYGAAEWRRLAPLLIDQGLLTELDIGLFATYCANYDAMVIARQDLAERGPEVEGSRGLIRNPSLAAFQAATAAIRTLGAELGLSPRSRSRITLPDDSGDMLAELLGDDGIEDAA